MKRFFALALTVFMLFCFSAEVFAEPDNGVTFPEINSRGASLYNLETGITVFSKNGDTRMFPASTTKIMTAMLVLEKCPDPENTFLTVGDTSVFQYIIDDKGVVMALKEGEVLSVYDLLAGLMLNSYCDVAEFLAYEFGGKSVENFVSLMNEKAASLGCTGTHFENAHGLHNENHYSTPDDMCRIFAAAVDNPKFVKIISLREYTVPATALTGERKVGFTIPIYKSDSAPEYSRYYLDEYVGGKSGFTDEAGRCLCTFARKDGASYVLTLFGAGLGSADNFGKNNPVYKDTFDIISCVYGKLAVNRAYKKGAEVTEVPVVNADESVTVTAGEDVYLISEKGKQPEYSLLFNGDLWADKVKNGAQFGYITPTYGGRKSAFSKPLTIKYSGVKINENFTEEDILCKCESTEPLPILILAVLCGFALTVSFLLLHLDKKYK